MYNRYYIFVDLIVFLLKMFSIFFSNKYILNINIGYNAETEIEGQTILASIPIFNLII